MATSALQHEHRCRKLDEVMLAVANLANTDSRLQDTGITIYRARQDPKQGALIVPIQGRGGGKTGFRVAWSELEALDGEKLVDMLFLRFTNTVLAWSSYAVDDVESAFEDGTRLGH